MYIHVKNFKEFVNILCGGRIRWNMVFLIGFYLFISCKKKNNNSNGNNYTNSLHESSSEVYEGYNEEDDDDDDYDDDQEDIDENDQEMINDDISDNYQKRKKTYKPKRRAPIAPIIADPSQDNLVDNMNNNFSGILEKTEDKGRISAISIKIIEDSVVDDDDILPLYKLALIKKVDGTNEELININQESIETEETYLELELVGITESNYKEVIKPKEKLEFIDLQEKQIFVFGKELTGDSRHHFYANFNHKKLNGKKIKINNKIYTNAFIKVYAYLNGELVFVGKIV